MSLHISSTLLTADEDPEKVRHTLGTTAFWTMCACPGGREFA